MNESTCIPAIVRLAGLALIAPALLLACGGPEPTEAPNTEASTRAVTPTNYSFGPGQVFSYTPPRCTSGSFSCGGREKAISAKLAKTCTDDRWVGFQLGRRAGACPQASSSRAGTWTARPLFTAQPGTHVALPDELRRFCVYEWQPRAGTTYAPRIYQLPNSASMRLERDCKGVTPLFTPSASAGMAEAAFQDQVNVPEFPAGTNFPSRRVDVAVIDTAPDGPVVSLSSPTAIGHGFGVGAIIREVSALREQGVPNSTSTQVGDAAVRLLSYQGMPLGTPTSHGRPTDVADAINRATSDWLGSGATSPLIINLSLGWDGSYGGEESPKMRISGLSALLAARWATCSGALVIAASGNTSALNGAKGTMYPAGWEAAPRLCTVSGAPANHPVVVSAGPLDSSDEIPLLARASSAPRVLVPATYATGKLVNAAGNAAQGQLLTGSSVSAAALSGAAALVWYLDPSATADGVMRALHNNGVTLPTTPDVIYPGYNPTTARLDTCASAQDACAGSGLCPNPCARRAAGQDTYPAYDQFFDAEFPGVRAGGPMKATITPAVSLNSDEGVVHPNIVVPQPEGTYCPVCTKVGPDLVGKFDSEPGTQIETIILHWKACDFNGDCHVSDPGLKLELEDPEQAFVVEIEEAMGLEWDEHLVSAFIETTVIIDGKYGIYGSEVVIK